MVAERVGRYVQQPTGYRAFIPAALPPDPPVRLDEALSGLLSHALLDEAEADVMAYLAFLPEHWRQIWSNNPLEMASSQLTISA